MFRLISFVFSRVLPWIVLVHVLVFFAFWLTNGLFYASTNDYLADLIGRRLNYISLVLGISALFGVWSFIRILQGLMERRQRLSALPSFVYGLASLLFILFFYGSFQLLFKEAPVQRVRLGQLVVYFQLFLDAALLLGLALLAANGLRNWLQKRISAGRRSGRMPLAGLLLVSGFLWRLPLVFPPGSVAHGLLPDKPRIIAHRGASMLAPENTLAAAQAAAALGVYGLETDIQISRDGALFLLHDDTFERTTDIQSIFPGREQEPAGNFTLAEINQLHAGGWFLDRDPFRLGRRAGFTWEQQEKYQQQSVGSLSTWLELVKEHNQAFIFDLKTPPEDHPYAAAFFERVVDEIRQAEIDELVWFLVDEEQLLQLRTLAPQIKPAYGARYTSPPPADELKTRGYRMVNVEYGLSPRWIRQYREAGLWVNVYTVDEPWQFSRLWILGVDSITTSNSHVMTALNRPVLGLTYRQFFLVWMIVGLLALAVIIWRVYPVGKPGYGTRHLPPAFPR